MIEFFYVLDGSVNNLLIVGTVLNGGVPFETEQDAIDWIDGQSSGDYVVQKVYSKGLSLQARAAKDES